MKRFLVLIFIVLLCQCGGNSDNFTPLKKPVSISLSTTVTRFENQNTQLAYVADAFTQSLIVLNTVQGNFVDAYENDNFDFSPIAIGGEPSAVIVDDAVTPYRIYVADRFNKQIIAYEISSTISPQDNFISYTPVDLGGTAEGKSSRYLFKEAGAASTPTMTSVVVDPAKAKNEAWRLINLGNGSYQVSGSVSGIQTNRARENRVYTSDNGQIEFFISSGGERTTEDDQFFFSTAVVKPLQLTTAPVDMVIRDRKLYILTQDALSPTLVVYDLDALAILGTFPLPVSPSMPNHLSIVGNKIYISDPSSGQIFLFNTDSQVFTVINTTLSGVRYVKSDGVHLFLAEESTARLFVTDLSGANVKSMNLNDTGNFMFMKRVAGKLTAYIPNISGNVDVVDTTSLSRIDTNLDDQPDFINLQFYDVLPVSSPQLISVSGKPNIVRNETWQMVFEGVIPNAIDLNCTIAGNVLTCATATFQTSNALAGDHVLITGEDDELEIDSITDQTHLVLTTAPTTQGSARVEIRANGTYLLTGSKSGTQENRITPGEAYVSDASAISLRTRPSFSKPETRGDFFTFQTLDPIQPIQIFNQSMAVGGVGFTRISDGKSIGYILQQTNGQVSIVNLSDFSLEKTL